jgi:hypothetical protein
VRNSLNNIWGYGGFTGWLYSFAFYTSFWPAKFHKRALAVGARSRGRARRMWNKTTCSVEGASVEVNVAVLPFVFLGGLRRNFWWMLSDVVNIIHKFLIGYAWRLDKTNRRIL